MALRKPGRWLIVASGLLVLALCAGLTAQRQWWRVGLIAMKARGRFTEITWTEMAHLVRPGSGFWLEQLGEQPNPYKTIHNPFTTRADLERGGRLFREQCAACHGADARGTGNGPPLSGVALTRANSDWATYKVVSGGIGGTSMAAHPLPWRDTWRLVGFVRSMVPPEDERIAASPRVYVPAARLVAGQQHPQDWLTYSGSYDGSRLSALAQIDAENVSRIQVRWIHRIQTQFERVQAVPLVSDGVMFFSAPLAKVFAIDAATGKLNWAFEHAVPDYATPCCGKVNRGLALLDDRVFIGTLDAHLIALDTASGKEVWDAQVADGRDQYTITSAPLALRDKIVTGISGGDFTIRGFIAAYGAKDGALAWRFETVPGPGAPGHDSWQGESWRTGGAATWMTGSYDPDSNAIYWGVGNPAPAFNGSARAGDNLYSNSVVALDADSGKMRWYYQFTPHNLHDWDSTQVPVLIADPRAQARGRLLAWPNRNAFYYLLDAGTGQHLLSKPFARQTWADGLDATGRPKLRAGMEPSVGGTLVYPSAEGATNWWPSAFSTNTGLLYVPVLERAAIYFASEAAPRPEHQGTYLGYFLGSGQQGVAGQKYYTAVRALDPLSGELKWERRWPDRTGDSPELPGLLVTKGDVVFGADRSTAFALSAKTGEVLWSFDTGAPIAMPPMTYEVGGVQYVAFISGKLILAFGLPAVPAGR